MSKMKKISMFLMAISFAGILNSCSKEESYQEKVAYSASMAGETTTAKSAGVYNLVSVEPLKGDKLPELVFNKDGKNVKLSEYAKGKVVFLNFWGTWCPPCRREIPDIIKLQEDYKGKMLVIGVAMERAEDPMKAVSDFGTKNGLNYINILDNDRKISDAFGGISGVPTTYFVDKKGVIKNKIVGMGTYEGFKQEIDKAMN